MGATDSNRSISSVSSSISRGGSRTSSGISWEIDVDVTGEEPSLASERASGLISVPIVFWDSGLETCAGGSVSEDGDCTDFEVER